MSYEGRGSQLSHLAQSAGPGLQTVSSICAKMPGNPPPGEDELEKKEGEPGEMRSGRRDGGVSQGLAGSGSGVEKES